MPSPTTTLVPGSSVIYRVMALPNADYVVYGTYSTFTGRHVYAALAKDGMLYNCSNETAREFTEKHPDKWIKASSHPACGVYFKMPDGTPCACGGRELPFEASGKPFPISP